MTNSTPPEQDQDQDDDFFEWAGPSKSQLKRDAHRQQQLGIELTELKPDQLVLIPLSSTLEDALVKVKSIKKNEALRRHHQLIGKLMRSEDTEAIAEALEKIKASHDRDTRIAHAAEQWRDDLIKGDNTAMSGFIDKYPNSDRQLLRQLVKAAKKDVTQNKPALNARKLFKLLRSTMSQAPDE